ncbi:MAG: substrate-binding domain-containing protein [Lachnospiraceae bacterium]|nr:substrate-binding domain-containing protein [Lachnospiraceae bacterium]
MEGMGTLKQMLLDKKLDLAITETSEIGGNSLLDSHYICRGYSAVALSKDHPLAKKDLLSVKDLENETVIMADNTFAPRSIVNIHKRMEKSGVDMKRARLVDHFENALAMCEAGLGIVFLPRPFKVNSSKTLVYRDVDAKEMYLDYSFIWHHENENPCIKDFIQFLENQGWTLE